METKSALDQSEFLKSTKDARAALLNVSPFMAAEEGADLDATISDKDGLVTYINASSNTPPPQLEEEQKKISAILEGLTGILTAVVILDAGKDTAKKHDPNLWNSNFDLGLQPFFAGYSFKQEKYYKKTKGIEVAKDFIQYLLSAVVTQGAALADFTRFLGTQGESMQASTGGEGDSYKYAIISMVHEIFESSPGQWKYVPKIKYYFTSFSTRSFEITTSCGSYREYEMNFELQVLTASFKIDTWRTEQWFKDEVSSFIKEFTQAKISDSKNHFKEKFQSKKQATEAPTEEDNDAATLSDSYPGHQCFKTKSRDVYCSGYIVKNHDEGAAWISDALVHFDLRASDILGKPYIKENIPAGAIVWPDETAAV
jgi:hypothetical protein